MTAAFPLLAAWLKPDESSAGTSASPARMDIARNSDLLGELAAALGESPHEPVRDDLQGAAHTILERLRHPAGLTGLHEERIDLQPFAALGEALRDRCQSAGSLPDSSPLKRAAWAWLDLLRRSPFPGAIAAAQQAERFAELAVQVVDASDFTFGRLFAQRASTYGPRTLFRVPSRQERGRYTWLEVSLAVDRIASGLMALTEDAGGKPVAMLAENSYESAIVDLACLTSGIVNVMIPANLTPPDVEYILRESQAGTIVVSSLAQLKKVPRDRARFPALKHVIVLDEHARAGREALSLAQVAAHGRRTSVAQLRRRREQVKTDHLATVMYTSGTTGSPKGIRFSQRNIVSKRFCRGLALPEIGDSDVLVCYLPLFHTFGRYLELCGCIYWGATYVFQESPAVDLLSKGLSDHQASVLISIPKKWMELYEEVGRRVDLDTAAPERIQAATREVVGPRLRFGLSAAGYLPPEIFRFFQSQGVELMSGFGMTEATGGILMTPPGQYREGSLGVPLPGIEVKLVEDGELALRGPYVMLGYAGDIPSGVDEQGWVRSGDLMWQDETGHYFFVDRKKEIYKNLKGQTIAPQRIENLFRELEGVKNVFLVGDRRDYNTVLFVPTERCAEVDFTQASASDKRDYFRGLVFSVNQFLAPYERVLDFAVLDRDFSQERGELTPKSTFRRSKVVENFEDTVAGLYRKGKLHFPGVDVALRVPYWLFQAGALTTEDVQVQGNRLRIASRGTELTVTATDRPDEPGASRGAWGGAPAEPDPAGRVLRIGACAYQVQGYTVDLGVLLRTPELWLGNEDLLRLVDLAPGERVRGRRAPAGLRKLGRVASPRPADSVRAVLMAAVRCEEVTLEQLDTAASAVLGEVEETAQMAAEVLGRGLEAHDRLFVQASLHALRSASRAPCLSVRRLAFQLLFPAERENQVDKTLDAFLALDAELIDEETATVLSAQVLSDAKLAAFIKRLKPACAVPERRAPSLAPWIRFVATYGAAHPASFRDLRWVLTYMRLFAPRPKDRVAARQALQPLTEKFRAWIRPAFELAIEPGTEKEYQWRDVLVFHDDVPEEDRERLLSAVPQTAMLREALFLLGGGTIIGLSRIQRGGLTVSFLGDRHGKRVYRLSVQTRNQGVRDIVVNVAHGLSDEQAAEEVDWLTVAAEPREGDPLVERVGGYWPEHRIWTEEFIPGETVEQIVSRLACAATESEDSGALVRLRALWPFLVWSAAWAYIEFWQRSGRRLVLGSPHPAAVIVPSHDYLVDPRVVSLSDRKPFHGVGPMLADLWDGLVCRIESTYPALRGVAGQDSIFSALLEVTGTATGLDLLLSAEHERPELAGPAQSFIDQVRERGFCPRRLHFAIERFHRWGGSDTGAPRAAAARNLRQIYEIYHLAALRPHYPETRVRFFRETVFANASQTLAQGLDEILVLFRSRPVDPEELVDRVAALRIGLESGTEEEYFLARMLYPHLQPEDAAAFGYTGLGGLRQTDLVANLTDRQGASYAVRRPVNPREIGRVQRLFEQARLPITFRPEQHFLVAVPDRGDPVGALVYDLDPETAEAHFDKIAVSDAYRRAGVAEGLMHEFLSRMTDQGIRLVTAGYFRPELMRRFGFQLDSRHAGQALELGGSE